MKPQTRSMYRFVPVLIVATIFMASCSSLPSGQVKGILVQGGEPLSGRMIFLGKFNNVENDQGTIELNTSWKTKTDDDGSFFFEGMLEGKYTIIIFSDINGFSYVLEGGEKYSFELTEASGVNLGRIDATNTSPVQ